MTNDTTAGGPEIPQQRRVVTEIPGPRSRELFARRQATVPQGIGTQLPVFVEGAGGGVAVDVDGNSLIDFGAGIAVVNVGNSAPRVVERVQRQVARFTHNCFMVTPYESYVEVCEHLNRLTPGDHEKRSFLLNSGTEAVENAVKVARHATGRPAVIVLEHAFHGRTHLSMTLTAKNMPYKHGFGPSAPEVYRVPMAYPYRWPSGPESCGPEAAATAIDQITTQVGADNVAAVLVEPIQGEGGFIVPAAGFLPRIAEFCRDNGIALIADEVQTGFGRTGRMFACEHEGIVPDLIATAKGIAGGFPLGGVTGRAELVDHVHPGGLGGTFGGNPVACEAALGAIATIEGDGLVERAERLGATMQARLHDLAARTAIIGDVRGRGAMVAVEVVRGHGDSTPDPEATRAVQKACHAAGLIVLTCGTYGNVLRFLPPLVMPDHLLDEGLGIVEEAFATVWAGVSAERV